MPAAKWNYSFNLLLPDMMSATKIIIVVIILKERVGGWRAGERKNGSNGKCVLLTACHHPLLIAKKSVFMLTVTEHFCSLIFKHYTQKY